MPKASAYNSEVRKSGKENEKTPERLGTLPRLIDAV